MAGGWPPANAEAVEALKRGLDPPIPIKFLLLTGSGPGYGVKTGINQTFLSWVDWTLLDTRASLFQFVKQLIAFRHHYPILRRNLFLTGQPAEDSDVRDVTWINANGGPMEEQHWTDTTIHCFGMLLDGRAPTTGRRQPGTAVTVLVLINGHHEPVEFTLPPCVGASEWSLLLDTNLPERPQDQTFRMGAHYLLTDRSLVLLVLGAKRVADVIPA